jgi:hypothetical protein
MLKHPTVPTVTPANVTNGISFGCFAACAPAPEDGDTVGSNKSLNDGVKLHECVRENVVDADADGVLGPDFVTVCVRVSLRLLVTLTDPVTLGVTDRDLVIDGVIEIEAVTLILPVLDQDLLPLGVFDSDGVREGYFDGDREILYVFVFEGVLDDDLLVAGVLLALRVAEYVLVGVGVAVEDRVRVRVGDTVRVCDRVRDGDRVGDLDFVALRVGDVDEVSCSRR